MPPQNPQNPQNQQDQQNPQPEPNSQLRDANGYLHTPETMPQAAAPETVPTSQYGNVEVQHVGNPASTYGYQAAQPLQPLPHKPDEHPLYPAPAAAKPDEDPYAFFLNGKPAGKKSALGSLKKSSKITKIIVAAAVVVIGLMIAAVIVSSGSKSGGSTDATGTLGAVVLKQQEILRVGKLATPTIESGDLKDFTATAIGATTTAQQQLISYITSHGGKFDSKQLDTYVGDSKVDQSLDAAQAASTYDATYQAVMKQLLTDYAYSVASAKQQSASANTKKLMDQEAANLGLLQTMLLEN